MARLGRAQPFRALLRPFRAPASPDVTVALTGVGATGAVGLLGVALAVGLSGAAGTGSVGSVTPAPSAALSSVSATGSVGSVTPSSTVPLTGVTGTGEVGSVTTGADVTAALTGVGGSGSVGSLVPSTTIAATGVGGTGSVGSVSIAGTPLTGVEGTGAVGSVTSSRTVALTGVSGTGGVGTVVVPGTAVTVALTGVGATGSVGSFAAIPGGAAGTGPNRENLLPPVPNKQEIVDTQTGRMDPVWLRWQREVKLRVEALPAESLAAAQVFTTSEVATATTAAQTYADASVTTAVAAIAAKTDETEVDAIASNLSVNLAVSRAYRITLETSTTVTFTDAAGAGPFVITLVQGGAGSHTCAITGALYPGGVAPVLSTTAGAIDRLIVTKSGADYLVSAETDFS
jgi:hypothetical protein